VAAIDPDALILARLMDEKLEDAEIIVRQAQQIAALQAAVRVQGRAICLLTGLLISDRD
jgi:hypothetical protein